ncbi:phage integrase SAM-like domain-containing protein [Phocaeicola dorei]|jgi:hypothetical protein|uniref:phage integrase SAM-like domain-containing protein n=1 Tax=Phocaeicola dorei TaxID=357276 RepID=UPI0002EEE446|nr:phage integrase SAM-like domain-containing protein [Phocaeicola dorei]
MKTNKTAGKIPFFQLLESGVWHFKDTGKEKTTGNHSCAMKHFTRFRNKEDIDTAELTVNLMKNFSAQDT